MTGHFEKGMYVEGTGADVRIENSLLNAGLQYYKKFNSEHPPAGVVWLESTTGLLVVCTPDPKYGRQLKRLIGRLK